MNEPADKLLTKKKVLCADDEPVNLQLLEALLRSNGYDVVLAKDGREALEILRREPVDILLLDVKMPKMDGYEVCRTIKGDEKLRNIPVIMLTALTDKIERRKDIEEAEEFLSKPFRLTEVLARVKTLLKMKELNDTLHTAYEEITNLKRLQASKPVESEPKYRNLIERSGKLDTIEGITAGVVHEIKNHLNIIYTSMQLLMMDEFVKDKTMESYGTIIGQVDRASNILDNFKEFACDKKTEIKKIELNELITKTTALVSYEMKAENITIAMNFKQYATYVNGDMGQLAQVFLKIIDNARKRLHEMEETYSYDKLNEDGWAGYLNITLWEDPESVYVNFEDNGIGIPETVIDAIFATAQNEDDSTGSGLSVTYGIIKNQGGNIGVQSSSGKTVFTVSFPVLTTDNQ